jgi:hypothetical protein
MAKAKINPKEFLLKKGEYIALGGAGLALLILLLLGVSAWSEAKDPQSTYTTLQNEATRVQNDINTAKTEPGPVPPWIAKIKEFNPVDPNAFAVTGPWFDPIAKPDTKRENPTILPIGKYQVELVRAPMKGFDLQINAGEIRIGIVESKRESAIDPGLVKQLQESFKKKGGRPKAQQPVPAVPVFPGGPMGPGPFGPGPMGPGPGAAAPSGPPSAPGGSPRGGSGPGAAMPVSPYGGQQSGYEQSGQRMQIRYIPLDDLDKEMSAGKVVPAMTVIPLRMVVVYATFPIKKQIEECKRALRQRKDQPLPLDLEPVFDGFEIKRRVSLPNGQIVGEPPGTTIFEENSAKLGWQDYDFDAPYVENIDSRKMADHFDVDPRIPDSQYLPYFIRYDQDLWMPLPELVTELASYPTIKIDIINEAIRKLKEANRPPETPSSLYERIHAQGKRESGKYTPQSGNETGAGQLYGSGAFQGPSGPRGGAQPLAPVGGNPRPGAGGAAMGPGGLNVNTLPELEDLLVRFIDCNVQPGFTYEYQIRVKMKNPNFGKDQVVSNPEFAKEAYKTLRGPWVLIEQPITVPGEYFLYAYDVAKYRGDIEAAHKSNKQLLTLLQAKDNQAVVQIQSWMEQVRLGDRREPVGAWVVAEMPVGRGEFIGKKQYVRLPLWESTSREYQLRETPEKVLKARPGQKEPEQPKGWLVDFTTKSVLVDFEGGKVKAPRPGGGTIDEDAATEMLILRPDGKLIVRNSETDTKEKDRTERNLIWDQWLKAVEQRKSTAPTGGAEQPGTSPFGPGGGGRPGGGS